MKRKFTIKMRDQNGLETVEMFKTKKAAMAYCLRAGQLKGRFDVEIIVESSGAKESVKFVRENNV